MGSTGSWCPSVSALAANLSSSRGSWAREQRRSVGAAPRSRQDAEQLSHVTLQNLPRGAVSEVVEVQESVREADRERKREERGRGVWEEAKKR